MISTSIRVALSVLFFAAALALGATGAAQAQSVMKQCGDEWKAAKANNTTNGMTWPQFLSQCRTQKAGAATPAAAPARSRRGSRRCPAPAPAAAPAPAPAPRLPPCRLTSRSLRPCKRRLAATGAGQFTTEAQAKARCPSDTVVWVNTKGKSHTYHYQGTRWYGTTKQGAYMCEADAGAAGYHASKSRTGQPKQQP